jgi:hypothetical protein
MKRKQATTYDEAFSLWLSVKKREKIKEGEHEFDLSQVFSVVTLMTCTGGLCCWPITFFQIIVGR